MDPAEDGWGPIDKASENLNIVLNIELLSVPISLNRLRVDALEQRITRLDRNR